MNAPPPAPPPHRDEESPLSPEIERRAVGRRAADHQMREEWLREYEAKQREREERERQERRAHVWKLVVPALSVIGGIMLAMGFGYVTPSSRIVAVEKAMEEIRTQQEEARQEQATTRRQLTSLLIIRCLDAQTSREILIAAGVNCEQLMRDNGLR